MTFEELNEEAKRHGCILVKLEINPEIFPYVDQNGRPFRPVPDENGKAFQKMISECTQKSAAWHMEHKALGFMDPIADILELLNSDEEGRTE